MASVGAALRLPETGHSCIVQHFRREKVRFAGPCCRSLSVSGYVNQNEVYAVPTPWTGVALDTRDAHLHVLYSV